MIFYGGVMGFSKGISYSNRISLTHNNFNESLSVEEDGYNLYFKAFGSSILKQKKDLLTFEGAAEYYWEMFIEPLQKS